MALSAVLLLVPLPGSLSVVATQFLATNFAEMPGVDLVSEAALLVLAAGVALSLLVARAWTPGPWRLRVWAAVAAVPVAYGASEAIKLVFSQARPCDRWALGVDCPPAGDWSFPSNHATLAFGAVAVIVITLRSLWASTAASLLAVIVCVGRVAQGAHYLHDVAAGALLGIMVVLAGVFAVTLISPATAHGFRSSGTDSVEG